MDAKHLMFKEVSTRWGGAWPAQPVTRLTLDVGSGSDFADREFEPGVGLCSDSAQSLLGIPSLPRFTPPRLSLSL